MAGKRYQYNQTSIKLTQSITLSEVDLKVSHRQFSLKKKIQQNIKPNKRSESHNKDQAHKQKSKNSSRQYQAQQIIGVSNQNESDLKKTIKKNKWKRKIPSKASQKQQIDKTVQIQYGNNQSCPRFLQFPENLKSKVNLNINPQSQNFLPIPNDLCSKIKGDQQQEKPKFKPTDSYVYDKVQQSQKVQSQQNQQKGQIEKSKVIIFLNKGEEQKSSSELNFAQVKQERNGKQKQKNQDFDLKKKKQQKKQGTDNLFRTQNFFGQGFTPLKRPNNNKKNIIPNESPNSQEKINKNNQKQSNKICCCFLI